MDTLNSLFSKYCSDKGFDRHLYGNFYEQKLLSLKYDPIIILEIGLCIGGIDGIPSLMAWRDWFPNAIIIGIDNRDFTRFKTDRINIFQLDQGNKKEMELFAINNGPFDIVIDDGSHESLHIIDSIKVLLPYTKKFYFVEDLIPSLNMDAIVYLDSTFNDRIDKYFSVCKEYDSQFLACVEVK